WSVVPGPYLVPGPLCAPRTGHHERTKHLGPGTKDRHELHEGFRFSRNALSPSWPSGDTLSFAMTDAVVAAASMVERCRTSRISALAAAIAPGALARISRTYSATRISSSCPWT